MVVVARDAFIFRKNGAKLDEQTRIDACFCVDVTRFGFVLDVM